MINYHAQADRQVSFRELTVAVNALRGQVHPADRQTIDESLRSIGTGANIERPTLRQALSRLAGIAAVVGEVGAPVVEAVRKVSSAFGL
jgi:hypothetical protein